MTEKIANDGKKPVGTDEGARSGEAAGADENKLVAERREKLRQLRESAPQRGPAFPNDFRRSALAGQLVAAYGAHEAETLEREAIEVRVSGRLMSKRVMGKNTFAHVQDRSGQIQLFVQRDAVGEAVYADFKKWDLGDIVGARGKLFRTRTGEVSVAVEEVRLLVKSLRPLPEKWHGIADAELKVRQRYLDLIMNERTRDVFRSRTQVVRVLRSFLDALDFVEVETPLMHPLPGGAAARPFDTHHRALDMTLYLRIAPELYLKRLLVGGFERVYELGRAFRNEGLSTRHNPEFTILEVYQAYADFREAMALTERLVRETARSVLGGTVVEYQGERFDLGPEFRRKRLEEALAEAHPSVDAAKLRDVDVLRSLCDGIGLPYERDFGAGKLQLELFEKTVEERLRGPVFITHYPAEVSPLARRNDADPFLTDRFELFIAGREMANGFSELNDPEDQADRFRAQALAKARGDEEAMVYDEDYIRALEHGMPPAAGIGLGVDRLVMFLTDSPSIRDVLLFPQLKPES
jgi:lysyl-tRNA synthetase class 2